MSEASTGSTSYRAVSLWHETSGDDFAPRPALTTNLELDVAVVGAGYTGLWTAYYLARARPDLRIAVLEKDVAGFGASGRNGGWASALFPQSLGSIARESGREQALALHRAMRESIDEIIRVTVEEGIDADIAKGGSIHLARSRPQLERARAEVEDARSWGLGEDDLALLDADAARARLNATDVLGATYTPDCAAIHPAKLVRGLAHAVERLGVTIYERTPVVSITPHRVRTPRAVVTADFVVRATEGWTQELPGLEREIVPVYSLITATDPLPQEVWDEIGLARRETFADHRHLVIYGQRTADDRMVFGGRGAPYHFGSTVRPEFDRDASVHSAIRRTLRELFPVLEGVDIPHAWGGNLGIARDWHASVGLDLGTGVAWAGGYVGDGVTTTNLAARTLCDLVLGDETELTGLPWVNHHSPKWEREPLRWSLVNLGLTAAKVSSLEERLTGRSSLVAKVLARFTGH